jgi:hypothetical protein
MIGAVRFERIATLLYQGVKGGLKDVALVEIGSVVTGVSTLQWSRQNVFTHKTNKSRKPDGPVWQTGLSSFIGSGGSQGHRWLQRGHPSPCQVASDQEGE